MATIMIIHMEMKHDIEYFKNFLGIMGDSGCIEQVWLFNSALFTRILGIS